MKDSAKKKSHMNDSSKTKSQLMKELDAMRGRIEEIERADEARREAEEKIGHLNAVLHTIRNVNQLILKEKDRDKLLQGICDTLVQTHHYYSAWVVLFSVSRNLVTASEAGVGDGFQELVSQIRDGKLPDCMQRVLAQSEVTVIHDPPSFCPDCPIAKRYGGREILSIRLEYEGVTYGIISVSTVEGFTAGDEEKDLLKDVASDIAFTLYNMEMEKQRTLAIEELQRSEERYYTLFKTMVEGVAIHDVLYDADGVPVDYVIRDVNPAFEVQLGIPRERARGSKASELYGTGEPPYFDIYRRVAETREPTHFETYFEPMDKYFEISVFSPLKGQFATVFQDVTGRKRTEEALRESEERYRTVINSMGDAIHVIDDELRFILFNPAFEELNKRLGLETDVLGRTIFKVYPFLPDTVRDEYRTVFETGEVLITKETTAVKGKEYVTETRKIPIIEKGRAIMVITVIRDITELERKRKGREG